MLRLWTAFQSRIIRDEEGATAIEYGLLAALIALAIIVAVTALGGTLSGVFSSVDSGVGGATT